MAFFKPVSDLSSAVVPSLLEIPPGPAFSAVLAAAKDNVAGSIWSPTSAVGVSTFSSSSPIPGLLAPYDYFNVPGPTIGLGPTFPEPTLPGSTLPVPTWLDPPFISPLPAAHADGPNEPGGEGLGPEGPDPNEAYGSYLEAQSSADQALESLKATNGYAGETLGIYTTASTLAAPSERAKVDLINTDVEITQIDLSTATTAALRAQIAADTALDAAFDNDPATAAAQAAIAKAAATSGGQAAGDAEFHYEEAQNISKTLMANNPDLLNLPKWPDLPE